MFEIKFQRQNCSIKLKSSRLFVSNDLRGISIDSDSGDPNDFLLDYDGDPQMNIFNPPVNGDNLPLNLQIESLGNDALIFFSFFCDCYKIEVFTGILDEYLKTINGTERNNLWYFFELLPANTRIVRIKNTTKFPRMHIRIDRSLTDKSIPAINFDNVQDILNKSNRGLSDNATRCKDFISTYMKRGNSSVIGPPTMEQLLTFVRKEETSANGLHSPVNISDFNSLESGSNLSLLKIYFDSKLQEMEQRIVAQFQKQIEEVIQNQNENFKKIFDLLQK